MFVSFLQIITSWEESGAKINISLIELENMEAKKLDLFYKYKNAIALLHNLMQYEQDLKRTNK